MTGAERLLIWWLTAPPEITRWLIWLELGIAMLVVLGLLGYLWALRAAKVVLLATIALAAWRWLTAPAGLGAPVPAVGGRGGHREGEGDSSHSARYNAVMGSGRWRRLRWRIIRRAQGRCERCAGDGPLDVHHLTYARLGAERESDCIAVCRPCHQEADRQRVTGRTRLPIGALWGRNARWP